MKKGSIPYFRRERIYCSFHASEKLTFCNSPKCCAFCEQTKKCCWPCSLIRQQLWDKVKDCTLRCSKKDWVWKQVFKPAKKIPEFTVIGDKSPTGSWL